jgi:uncharacterized protein YidB (DUF937 family)
MGLLDTIADVTNSLGKQGGVNQGLLNGVIDLLGGTGLRGIVDSFKKSGLEDVVKSWVSTGKNKPISVDQLKDALGSEKLEELASKAGIPADQTSKLLKDLLPNIIDKLTPNGKVEDNR